MYVAVPFSVVLATFHATIDAYYNFIISCLYAYISGVWNVEVWSGHTQLLWIALLEYTYYMILLHKNKCLCNSCYIGTSGLPDMYTRSPRGLLA